MKTTAVLNVIPAQTPAFSADFRTCVYRSGECAGVSARINLNDAFGMQPYCDYSISEYLEDTADYDSRTVLAMDGNLHLFSDGMIEILTEEEEQIGEAGLAMLAEMDEFSRDPATVLARYSN